jgi:LPPG:FO 2-phospho-L-lactate transferase
VIIALSGGVGGAKLALGLSRILPPEDLMVVVNTGDDFEHLGLSISPDIDTVTYTLAGLANRELGWGRQDETWSFMETMESLGGETWFRLGDRDVALHVVRTRRLRAGESLSSVTADLCKRLGIGPRVIPMTDDRVRTRLRTDAGWLDFQDYFVNRRCEPVVSELAFEGAAQATPHPAFMAALANPALQAVVICPSNPFISVEPILAIPGVRDALVACAAPIIAVSPIIAGRAVKGPTAKMMTELGLDPSAGSVAHRYADLLDGYVIDHADMAEVVSIDARVTLAQTMMTTLEDRETLARTVLDAAAVLRRRK